MDRTVDDDFASASGAGDPADAAGAAGAGAADGFASGAGDTADDGSADGLASGGGCPESPGTKAVINITVPLSALLGFGFAFNNDTETDANGGGDGVGTAGATGATVPGAAGAAGVTGSPPDSGPDPGGDTTATDTTTATNTGPPGSPGNPASPGGPVSPGLAVTEDGTVLALSAVRAMAPTAQIRRLIFDDRTGLPLDLGRAHRLAPGYLRTAAFAGHTTCAWNGGCDVPVSQCEADHITEFTHGGETKATNLQPLCSKHNRLKYRRTRTENTPKGTGAAVDNANTHGSTVETGATG